MSAVPAATAPSPAATPSPTATSAPSAGPSVNAGFLNSDILRVGVDGLAVRVSPSLGSSLAQGFRSMPDNTLEPIGDVRLNAGDFVSVHLGPLLIGDTIWYMVWPAEDGRLNFSTVWWDTNGDDPVGGVNPGWVAASVGEEQYLALERRPDSSEYESWAPGGPKTLVISGTGDYTSEPQARHDLYGLNWAAAASDGPSPCSFSVTLVPEAGAESVVVVDTSISDIEQGPMSGPDSIPNTPWGASADSWDSFTVSIRSGCSWVVRLSPLPHD